VSFLADAAAAAAELRRVVRSGGVVGVRTWEENGRELAWPLREARVAVGLEGASPAIGFRTTSELARLLADAGLSSVETEALEVEAEYADFDDFWQAALAAVGPDTGWLAALDDAAREVARGAADRALGSPRGNFTLLGRACAARATRD